MKLQFSHLMFGLSLIAACGTGPVFASSAALAPLRAVHFVDLKGNPHSIPDSAAPATVVIFIAHDCPISCAMLPEVDRIRKTYPAVPFYVVYAEPDFTAEAAKLHAKQYKIGSTCIVDRWRDLVKWSNAHVTPEALVVTRSGDVAYEGRIDNKFAGLGMYRASATTHELADALNEVTHGQPVKISKTTAVGCVIETMLLRGNG
jgi:hypothetical protein